MSEYCWSVRCRAAEEDWEEGEESDEEEAYEDLSLARAQAAAEKAAAKADRARRQSAKGAGGASSSAGAAARETIDLCGEEDAPLSQMMSQMTAEQQARLASDGFVLLPVSASEEPRRVGGGLSSDFLGASLPPFLGAGRVGGARAADGDRRLGARQRPRRAGRAGGRSRSLLLEPSTEASGPLLQAGGGTTPSSWRVRGGSSTRTTGPPSRSFQATSLGGCHSSTPGQPDRRTERTADSRTAFLPRDAPLESQR